MKKITMISGLLLLASSSAFAVSQAQYADTRGGVAPITANSMRGQLEGAQNVTEASYERFLGQLGQQDARFTGYWNRKHKWGNEVVYQRSELFDMERFEIMPLKLAAQNVGIVDYTSSSIVSSGIDFQNSVTKLSQGKPAIGPDNQEIVLCRLINSASAPYAEMSKSDFDVAYQLTGSRTPKGVLCLRSIFASSYWKVRKNDFVDYAGDIVQPWRLDN